MGTKHGYEEKKCSRCGKMKPRAEYPKRGGLACKACMREEVNAEKRAAYARDRLKPGYLARRSKIVQKSKEKKRKGEEK